MPVCSAPATSAPRTIRVLKDTVADARMPPSLGPAWKAFDSIRIADAATRIRGVVRRTPLLALDAGDPRIELRAKLENRAGDGLVQGARRLEPDLAARRGGAAGGVVCASSGNHGKALAWAAERAGVPVTIVMPANAYPNKIQACRDHGAEVVLVPTREAADVECARRVAAGARARPSVRR